jgi:hypothetical protein
VVEWLEATLDAANWPLSRALAGRAPLNEEPANDPEERSAPESFIKELNPGIRAELPTERLTALPTLQKLRVASFERLVREVLRIDPEATRASVLAELDAAGDNVRWLGRSIVFLRENE